MVLHSEQVCKINKFRRLEKTALLYHFSNSKKV